MITASVDFAPWLGVFETLRVQKGVPLFVPEHLAELQRSMEALGLTTNADFTQARAGLPELSGRWRWLVTIEGASTIFAEEEPFSPEPVTLSVSPMRVGSCNWDARFKTVSYLTHAQAGKSAPSGDAILLNEKGHVASAARGNLFWRQEDRLYTPAHEAGCRRGVVRGFVLARRKVEEVHFSLNHLLAADEIFLTNSFRGIVSIREVEGRLLTAFPEADKLRHEYEDEIVAQMKAAAR